jgi:hypothetical protein
MLKSVKSWPAVLLGMVGGSVMLFTACTLVPPVTVRTWPTKQEPFYPERDDPQFRVPWLDDSRPVGVVFSGGGTRSTAATLGQLRALHYLNWMSSVGYISAVSGGSWAAVPYTYLPPESKMSEKRFLGDYVPPEGLSDSKLSQAPQGSLTHAINHAWPVWMTLWEIARLRGDESFSAALGSIFLQPFGLGDRRKFFGFHREALENTLAANPHLTADDFLLARRGRPYLVIGATLVGKPGRDRSKFFPVEMTPLYSGILRSFSDPENQAHSFGGGFVESLAFDSYLPLPQGPPNASLIGDTKSVRIGLERFRFTLSDVIGASGAAPQATFLRFSVDNIGLPEFRQWPLNGSHGAREVSFGDGGHIDNIGLLPLLARKVPRILVFINTESPFDPNPKLNPVLDYPLYGDLIHYFRDPVGKKTRASSEEAVVRTGESFADVTEDDPTRVVIGSGPKKLKELVAAFREERGAGRPLVLCDNYSIVENKRFGVNPYHAKICWVYLDRTQGWINKLDQEHNRSIRRVLSERRHFPHYRTFFGRGLDLIRLRSADVNALSNLTAWSILEEKCSIGRMLGLAIPDSDPCKAELPEKEGDGG